MNSRYRNIQFISEEESKDKISFLDISITRSKIKVVTLMPSNFAHVFFSRDFFSHL